MTEFDLTAFLVGAGVAGALGLLALAFVRRLQGGSRRPPSRASRAPRAPRADAGSLPEGLRLEVQSLLQRRRKIEAVKLVRERMDWGLKRAKEAVEALE